MPIDYERKYRDGLVLGDGLDPEIWLDARHDGPYSFRGICASLGLSVSAARAAIRRRGMVRVRRPVGNVVRQTVGDDRKYKPRGNGHGFARRGRAA